MPTPIDYRSINSQLQEIGGEGVVYSAANLGSRVYKEFFATSRSMSDQVALEGLIELQNQWTEEERVWLTQRTVWPETLVLDRGQLKGFIMPRIEQRYFRKHVIGQNQKTISCEWNYLSFREKLLSNEVWPRRVDQQPKNGRTSWLS